ncbi:MAG: exodeoxyribonuclease VII small subunit [Rhodospirillales bacterium]
MAQDKNKSDDKIPADIKKMSFEEALDELEDIVRGLEDGSDALDESIAAYERGAALRRHCEQKLQEARTRVDKIVVGRDGEATTVPHDED